MSKQTPVRNRQGIQVMDGHGNAAGKCPFLSVRNG
jgi:hypothetical protein